MLVFALGLARLATASDTNAPAGFAIAKTPGGGLEISHSGKPVAHYIIDQGNKPYFYPVFGAAGLEITRAYPMKDVEGEQHDHPHHRGIWFGHESLGGTDSWTEEATFRERLAKPNSAIEAQARLKLVGRIQHVTFKMLDAGPESASIVEECVHVGHDGRKLLTEERRMTFLMIDGVRVLDFDQDLVATEGAVGFEDRKDAGLAIRVPTSMAVDSGKGGRIVTSEGRTDEDAWGTAAAWCDYHGPVEGKTVGVAILNHPASFRHPTRWHVRTYGLLAANAFGSRHFDESRPDLGFELKQGETLKLRHRFVFHEGDEKQAGIEAAWHVYSTEER